MPISLGRKIWTWAKIVLGACCLLISAMIFLAPEGPLEFYDTLEIEGIRVQATVTHQWDTENLGSRRTNALRRTMGTMRYTRHVTYRFQPENGPPVEASQDFEIADRSDGPGKGASLEVIYHPQRPAVHRLTEYSTPFRPLEKGAKIVPASFMLLLGLYLTVRNGMRVAGWRQSGAGPTSISSRLPRSPAPAITAPSPSPLAPRQPSQSQSIAAVRRARTVQGFGGRRPA